MLGLKVDCRDGEAERALVETILRLPCPVPASGVTTAAAAAATASGGSRPRPCRQPPPPELATVKAVSLRDGRAMLEVPVEGALTAKAWLKAAVIPVVATPNVEVSSTLVPAEGIVDFLKPMVKAIARPASADPTEAVSDTASASAERLHTEVWIVMVQALQGLAEVHAISDESTHRAVCLENILVAARPAPAPSTEAGAGVGAATISASSGGFRRAQLGPPAPAGLAIPSTEYLAPEVVRGQPFRQAADMYAMGVALRAACSGWGRGSSYFAAADAPKGGSGGGGGDARASLPPGYGPDDGPVRQALLQLLDSMLEEDASRRCTAPEVLGHCVALLCARGW